MALRDIAGLCMNPPEHALAVALEQLARTYPADLGALRRTLEPAR
jgi:hypothetical protein